MKLSEAFDILLEIGLGIRIAFFPTLKAILSCPSLIFKRNGLSRLFMAKLWASSGDGADQNGRAMKERLISPNARGVVLDIGAGYGTSVKYLDRGLVTRYVALEPNVLMHQRLRATANSSGFNESDGSLLIISCGAEDTASILSSIPAHTNERPIDTLISVLTLCSVPSPEATIRSLVEDILKPEGQLLFYEHVRSPKSDVSWWQSFWAPVWAPFFDGCRLDRPTHIWIHDMMTEDGMGGIWREREMWGDDADHLFPHQYGRYVKK